MPSIVERERHLQKVINRWENEGGAIAARERSRPEVVVYQKALVRRRDLGFLEPREDEVSGFRQ